MAKYALPAGEPTARVRVARQATPAICVHERQAQLFPDAQGYALVPAGRPVTLTAQFEGHDFVCIPAVSFTPEPGASYRQDFQVRSRARRTTVGREDNASVTPVAVSAPDSYGCLGRR